MSGYTKLSSSLITSTVWREPATVRVVWITMLALADQHGEVQGSVPGLADMARVTIPECEAALALFLAPDPYSRTQAFDGRRIEAIDGGWAILNHAKYRHLYSDDERREHTRKRVQRWREAKRGYDEQEIDRQGTCDCCGDAFEEPYSKYVVRDHDHETGKARGIVCQSCNKNVGLFENGKTILGDSTIYREYVERWGRGNAGGNEEVTGSNSCNGKQKQKQKQKQEKQTTSPDGFEFAWQAYPARPNNSKTDARKAYTARLSEGADPSAILDGVKRYAEYVAKAQTEPRFIKQAATFFGPGRHWESDYTFTPPPSPLDPEYQRIAAEASDAGRMSA